VTGAAVANLGLEVPMVLVVLLSLRRLIDWRRTGSSLST
jgi:hypothetical protein